MSAERFNQEVPESNSSASSPEASVPFRVPLPKEHNSERKSRRNRKRKKKATNQSAAQYQAASKDSPTTSKPETGGLIGLGESDFTLWQRPENNPKNQKSAMLGSKVVEVSGQSATPKSEASLDKTTTGEEKLVQPAVSNVEKSPDEQPKSEEPQQEPDPSTVKSTERPAQEPGYRGQDAASVKEKSQDDPGKPLEFHPQPMIQHQGREVPHQPGGADEQPSLSQPETHPQDDERPFDQPAIPHPAYEQAREAAQPPLQPPDPMSYRRRFWEEQPQQSHSQEADNPNHETLPPLHDYERLAYESHHSEPAYPANARHVEAPATVPSAKRYESDIPPGYQRSTVDVNRAAWTGVIAGWWLGRRGKRKAVERARKAGIKEGMAKIKAVSPLGGRVGRSRAAEPPYSSPRLEAEPIHSYSAPEGERTAIQPVSVETRNPLRPPERAPSVATKVAEHIIAPSAAVAILDRAVNRSALERIEIPHAVKIAAVKAAESAIIKAPEMVAPATGARSERQLGKRELMRIAKDIKIDGVPLKEVYKAHRIDEDGLRVVVDAYLRGGDIRQHLAQEIVNKEQSYERDPVLRHQHVMGEQERRPTLPSGRGGMAGMSGSYGGGGIIQTVGRALGTVATSTETTAKSAGRAIASGAKTAQRDIIDNSNTADWLSITAVVVLYSIILILLLS